MIEFEVRVGKADEYFDERQQKIRGGIYKRGFIAAMFVLLLNALLQVNGIIWASGFQQNLIMFMLIATVVCIEFHLRGVYFGKRNKRMGFALLLGIPATVLIILSCFLFVDGEMFIENNSLTCGGFFTVIAFMMLLNAVCGVVKSFLENKAKEDRNDETS